MLQIRNIIFYYAILFIYKNIFLKTIKSVGLIERTFADGAVQF